MVVEVQVVEVMEGQVVEVQVEHVAHLGVVLEEVDLHGAVGEVHHHGPARPEPGLQGRDTGQLVLLTHLGGGVRRSEGRSEGVRSGERKDLHVGASLQQVLLHVVPEVVQQLHLRRRRRGEERRGGEELMRRGGEVVTSSTFFSTVAGNSLRV